MKKKFFEIFWRIAIAASLSCSLVPIVQAAESTLTLESAIQKTLNNNPQLLQFALIRESWDAKRTTSALKPGYDLEIELDNFAGSGETKGFDSAEITVALSSVIELGDKRRSRVSMIDAHQERIELEQQVQTLDVLGEVTRTFIKVLTTDEEIRLTAEAIELSESLYKTVLERAKRGASSDAEVMRAKATLSLSRSRHESVRHKLERQKIALARFWGETTISFTTIEGDLFAIKKPQHFDTLFEKVKSSPFIAIFASDLRLKEAEVRLAKTQSKADLNWQFGIKRLEESDDTALTMGFSMPLFSERRNRSQIKSALAESNAIAYQRNDRILELHNRLFNAYSQRKQFSQAHLRLRDQIIPDLEKALSITRDAYERGRLKYQDWITAQQELLSAKQQLIETASASLLNQAVIEQLTAEPLTN